MRLPTAFLAVLLATALPRQAARTELHFGHLWDGTRLLDDVLVVVEGNRIASISDRQKRSPARAIDLRRYTALPGLIDLHTHVTYYWDRKPGTTPFTPNARPAVTVFLAQENARRTLETGVTTIRDLGASADKDFAMRDLVSMGAMAGPRMFVSGQGISAGRGGGPPNPAARAAAAQERIKAGADWVKVYGSRGSFDSVDTTQTITFEEMQAIVDAAHALGRKVAIHSYGPSGVKDAVRAGADSIEHGIELDDETIADMVRRRTVWVPTIDHNRYYVDAREEYRFAPETIGPLRNYIAKNLESTARAFKAGVRIGMGSDAVYTMFGQNTRELAWFVKAGMTPAQALATATTTAADLLGEKDRLGRLTPGFAADIIAIDGKPLENIEDVITGVRWVMKDGAVVIDKRGHPRPANER